VPKTIIKII